MEKALLILLASLACFSASARAPENALMYSGNLRRADGSPLATDSSFAMTFRIYDRPYSGTNDVLYWARTTPVSFKENGDFTVKLTDDSGAAVSGAKYSRLAECGGLDNWYVSVQPQGCREIKRRVCIARQHFAFHADSASVVSNLTASAIHADELKMDGRLSVRNFTFNKIVGGVGADGMPVKPEIRVAATNKLSVTSQSEIEYSGDFHGISRMSVKHNAGESAFPANGTHTLKSDVVVLGFDKVRQRYFSMPIPAGYTLEYKNIPRTHVIFSTENGNTFPYWPEVVYEIYSFGKQDWYR